MENDLISFINKVDNIIRNKPVDINIRLILEDIRRTAELASDIAEAAAMNQTIGEVITVGRRPLRAYPKNR